MSHDDWISLQQHRATRSEAVRAIRARVYRPASAELRVSFRVDGDIRQIWMSAQRESRAVVELWRHTCLEAFVAIDGQQAYHEFNFAPSEEWAVYAFRSYRDGALLAADAIRPRIAVSVTETLLEFDAVIQLNDLSKIHSSSALRVGLSAVIEEGGALSYWAIRHPAGRPDFHHADGFALLLEPRAQIEASGKLEIR